MVLYAKGGEVGVVNHGSYFKQDAKVFVPLEEARLYRVFPPRENEACCF